MTLEELALKFKNEIKANPSSQTVQRILSEINNIVYEDSKEKLSKLDKAKLLDLIKNNYTHKGYLILEHSDNSSFLKAVALLKSELEKSEDK